MQHWVKVPGEHAGETFYVNLDRTESVGIGLTYSENPEIAAALYINDRAFHMSKEEAEGWIDEHILHKAHLSEFDDDTPEGIKRDYLQEQRVV